MNSTWQMRTRMWQAGRRQAGYLFEPLLDQAVLFQTTTDALPSCFCFLRYSRAYDFPGVLAFTCVHYNHLCQGNSIFISRLNKQSYSSPTTCVCYQHLRGLASLPKRILLATAIRFPVLPARADTRSTLAQQACLVDCHGRGCSRCFPAISLEKKQDAKLHLDIARRSSCQEAVSRILVAASLLAARSSRCTQDY